MLNRTGQQWLSINQATGQEDLKSKMTKRMESLKMKGQALSILCRRSQSHGRTDEKGEEIVKIPVRGKVVQLRDQPKAKMINEGMIEIEKTGVGLRMVITKA